MNDVFLRFENELNVIDEPEPSGAKLRVKVVRLHDDEGDIGFFLQEFGELLEGKPGLATESPRGSLLPMALSHATDTIRAVTARGETVHGFA